jgi:hypothetical protein
MTPDDIREEIELAVVELIKAKTADGTMTEERGQQISQLVLDTLQPGMPFEELYRAIFHLDDACQELSPIVLPYAKNYEENIAQKATDMVASYIKVGKYDAAVKLAEDVINEKVNLQWQGAGKANDKSDQ